MREPHIIVSFFTPGDSPPDIVQNENTKQIIQFAFDDLDRIPGPATQKALGMPVLFGDEEAKKIAERVQFWRDKGIKTVVCHCDAGISRSAGAAAAMAKFYNGDDSEFFTGQYSLWPGVRYHPNMLVYRKMTKALERL